VSKDQHVDLDKVLAEVKTRGEWEDALEWLKAGYAMRDVGAEKRPLMFFRARHRVRASAQVQGQRRAQARLHGSA